MIKIIYLFFLVIALVSGIILGGQVFKHTRTSNYILSPIQSSFDLSDCIYEGADDAAVTLVEFSDIECPYSLKNQKTMDYIKKKYAGKIKVYFRNFPLSIHKNAALAAKAVTAAACQGKGPEMRDILFRISSFDSDAQHTIENVAAGLSLDMDKFRSYIASSDAQERLQREIRDGAKHGVRSTPTVFINGYLIKGAATPDVYSAVIDKCMNRRL